jgi:hypothetical protein
MRPDRETVPAVDRMDKAKLRANAASLGRLGFAHIVRSRMLHICDKRSLRRRAGPETKNGAKGAPLKNIR